MTMPSSRRRPRMVFKRAVRVASQPDRMRWSEAMACWAGVLTGTGEIFSLRKASSSARVSVWSVLSRRRLGQTCPVVGGAAGLHQNGGGRLQSQEAGELTSGQTLSLADSTGLARDRNFEDGLCQIHGDRRRMLHGLLLSERAAMTPNHVGTLMPFTWKEESISSLQRTPLRAPLSRKPLGDGGHTCAGDTMRSGLLPISARHFLGS